MEAAFTLNSRLICTAIAPVRNSGSTDIKLTLSAAITARRPGVTGPRYAGRPRVDGPDFESNMSMNCASASPKRTFAASI